MAGLFYLDDPDGTAGLGAVGTSVTLDGREGHHASTVRRIRVGEELTLGDGAGVLAHCRVTETGREWLRAEILDRWTEAPPSPMVTVVQALPKSDRSELAVELATEAGADAFIAWQAARCVARWEGARAEKGLRRWRATVRAAAAQSVRARIPDVAGVLRTTELAEWVRRRVTGGTGEGATGAVRVLVLHDAAAVPLRSVSLAGAGEVVLVVGPEGGVSDDELAALTAAGATSVLLGPTVLRTSTAAAVALGALGVLTERWGAGAEQPRGSRTPRAGRE